VRRDTPTGTDQRYSAARFQQKAHRLICGPDKIDPNSLGRENNLRVCVLLSDIRYQIVVRETENRQLLYFFASSEKSVGHRYAPMAAGSWACATLSRLCYLSRVLVRLSRCAIVDERFRLSLAKRSPFSHLEPYGIGHPRRHPYQAATVSGFPTTAKSRNRCSALRRGEPPAIGGRCRVQSPAEVLPQRRRRL
jgi:hypothetical protein